jgi:hypothetical protein
MNRAKMMRKANPQTPKVNYGPELHQKIKLLKQLLPDLQLTFGVRSLGIFGSYVRGEQRRKSDIDILVDFDRDPTLFTFIRLENRLSSELGLKVDLVMKDALKPAIGRHILQEVIPV